MKDLSGAEERTYMTQSNALTAVRTKLDGVIIVEPLVHGDSRGWFYDKNQTHYSIVFFEKP